MSKRNIVHVEIPAANVEGAGKFYADLFGWKITPMPEMNYTTFEAGNGDEYGGFPKVSDENPAGQVLVYIHSDDIDADLKKVVKLGGKVLHEKAEIPGTGWFGVFQDPTGNVLGVYTSMNPENN
jgi:uncharacterized protein